MKSPLYGSVRNNRKNYTEYIRLHGNRVDSGRTERYLVHIGSVGILSCLLTWFGEVRPREVEVGCIVFMVRTTTIDTKIKKE